MSLTYEEMCMSSIRRKRTVRQLLLYSVADGTQAGSFTVNFVL